MSGTAAAAVKNLGAALAEADGLYRRGAFAEAATLLAAWALPEQTDPTPFRLLGLAQLRLGFTDAALKSFGEAERRAPDDPWVALHFGIGLQTAGRLHDAVAKYSRAAERLPNDPAPLLNWAGALLALGDTDGAIRQARRARMRAPAMTEAHYVLGQALLAADRNADALLAFRRATELAPGFADAWVNLGNAEYRLGRIGAAKDCMRRALAADPNSTKAASNLAVFLRLTGGAEEAETLLKAASQAPDAAEARLNMATGLLQEGRTQEALAILAAEVPRDLAVARMWRLQHALALIETGQPAPARTVLDAVGAVPAALEPSLLWRRVLLARAEGNAAEAAAQAEAMDAALMRAGDAMLPENRIMAHFDLAKFWSGSNEPSRAMAFWVRGHALLRRMQPFSREAYAQFVDAVIGGFSRARLHAGPRASNNDQAPVFIVGMPRSGTTLAEQILGAHPAVHAAGERVALSRMFAELGRGGETAEAARRVAALDTASLDAAASRYLAELHALAPAAARIVDKMPGNYPYAGLASLMLPGARIIHCARDPRDIGLSIFTYRFYGEHPYAHDLGDLGWYIGQHDRLMAHWYEALPNPPLRLQLVAWVADFHGTLRRVLAFLDLPYAEECERYYERDTRVRTVSRAQVKEPVNARGLGRFRAYEAELAPLIAALPNVPELGDDEELRRRRGRNPPPVTPATPAPQP